jgi:hypothetical protein
MQQIDNIGGEANQQTQVTLEDGSVVTLGLRYLPAVQRWMMDVTHDDGTFLGLNVCVHPNLLRPWRNTLRFGIACGALDGVSPVDVNDFSTGRVALYVLSAAEVAQVERDIFGSAI